MKRNNESCVHIKHMPKDKEKRKTRNIFAVVTNDKNFKRLEQIVSYCQENPLVNAVIGCKRVVEIKFEEVFNLKLADHSKDFRIVIFGNDSKIAFIDIDDYFVSISESVE